MSYDAAGNLLNDGFSSYVFDGENRITTGANVGYTYDGDGRRVKKSSGKLYWYGTGSDALDETDLAGNTNNSSFNEYIFFGGKRIARRDYQNNVNYYFSDHLGSSRIVASSSGTVLDDSDFYPFGVERVVTSSSGNRYKFTGKERDSESGLDNFGARFDASTLGRFMSPDAKVLSVREVALPQKWNRYSYVLNNPMALIDSDGFEEKSFLSKLIGVFYAKGSVGPALQVGGKVTVTKGENQKAVGVEVGGSLKATGKVTTDGVSVSATKEIGLKLEVGGKVFGPQYSKETVTVKDGKALNNFETKESSSWVMGNEKAEGTASKGDVGVGTKLDLGLLNVQIEVGINTEKAGDLAKETLEPVVNAFTVWVTQQVLGPGVVPPPDNNGSNPAPQSDSGAPAPDQPHPN